MKIGSLVDLSLVRKDPLRSEYFHSVSPMRELFLYIFFEEKDSPGFASFNPLTDEYLRSDFENQLRMLTCPLVFRSMVNALREHEVLEAAALNIQNPALVFDFLKAYKNKIMLDNKRWLAYELANLLDSKWKVHFNYANIK